MAKRPKNFRGRILAQVADWNISEIQAEAAAEKETFLSKGVREKRYADRGVYGATYGAFMALQEAAIWHACSGGNDEDFEQAIIAAARMYFLDLRFSRACLLQTEGRTDYVRMIRELVAQASLSLILGLHSQAEWMYRQYLDNAPDTLSRADYIDPEIDALTRLTASLWLSGQCAPSSLDLDSFGVYGVIVESIAKRQLDDDALNRFVDERQAQAAWRYVDDSEGVGFTFFGDMFTALFPVEILALLRASEKYSPEKWLRKSEQRLEWKLRA